MALGKCVEGDQDIILVALVLGFTDADADVAVKNTE